MSDDSAVIRFAAAARTFCQWAESDPSADSARDMHEAQRHMALLYALALQLPVAQWDDVEAPDIEHDAWQVVFNRFGSLPVGYYSHCIDPLELDLSASTLGDLADDLADVWRDLKTGLLLFDAGSINAATHEWQENFSSHWGRHASGALYVLHCWAHGPGKRAPAN